MRPTLASTILRRSPPRDALRQRIFTRKASSGPEKAQEALATAQKQASQVWDAVKKFVEPAGQRLGGLLGSYKQPLLYNLSVTREIIKQVYVAERLQPPSLSSIRTAYATLVSRAISPAYWREVVQNGEILRIGVYGLEAYGIFKIGEILGRRSLVGYNVQ
ncbi:hypothetical protein AMATHDRAFT_151348 [Amanita thiersii Skay4041]|uniref:ATP synthase subunit n=1 Tax=Amanita thiersii Skay4041 TaxID=703135 RepID=A0A2A9NHK1_9AGAR|nr:hypothetical protein AMATHDRAFT_151348 [Amanita thiersii Skay4041]